MLLGRNAELTRIQELLADTGRGAGEALLLRGEPGIGKTSLLRASSEAARDASMLVIETSGVESEATLAFAALGELAKPIIDGLSRLPDPQRSALSAALGLEAEPGAGADRLAAFQGFVGLAKLAAGDTGLVIVVDDVHWLDPASAACLAFAARRVGEARASLIAAARTGEDAGPLEPPVIASLDLAGLEREHAIALMHRSADDLAPRAIEALLEVTLGNPLALIELPGMLSADQRSGSAPLDPVPAPAGALGAAYDRRLEALDPVARRALVVAATAFDRDSSRIVTACRELALPDSAIERCEAEGLLELTAETLTFAHPLLRSAAYAGATAADRREAHRALAENADPESRAWHLASAALGPDDETASALELAGALATGRGAHIAAADALERAAQLTAEGDSSPRLFAAGLAAALGGDFERAAALLESASETEFSPLRAMARHLLAMVRLTGGVGSALDNHQLLVDEGEAVEATDPASAAALYADAGVAAVIAGDSEIALQTAERASRLVPEDAPPTVRCQVDSILGMALALRARAAEAAVAFDRAGALLPEIELLSSAPQSIALALGGRVCTGQVATLREEVEALIALARERRSLGILPYLKALRGDAAFRLGDWETTAEEIDEATQMSELSGQLGPLALALAIGARAQAARGLAEGARKAADRAAEIARPSGKGAAALWAEGALGFLELGEGDIDAAIAQLERTRDLARDAKLIDPLIIPWGPDLVEAYARAGRMDDARQAADEFAAVAEINRTALALALSRRCQGIVSSDGDQEFEAALELHAQPEGQPFEHARTLLAYGSRLHRDRRRVEARRRLKEALAMLDDLGAKPWSDRARAELRAAGGLERKPVYDDDQLTAQEVRVARAVARGATNREVAAQLYLSPKTIEFHLGRVYRKLDIHSRAELATVAAEGGLEAEQAAPGPVD